MKKFLLTAILTAFTLVGFAQTDIDDKLSITTQMFLDEQDGKIEFNPTTSSPRPLGKFKTGLSKQLPQRLFVTPDTIDGKVYVSCYVRLEDNNNTSELESLGVVVQNKFIKGLITALIPIDKIEEVAAIANVHRINVSPLKRPLTNDARQKTNTDDVLTHSNDAQAAGLSKGYDGTGVLLGVIDTGIDFQHIAFKDKNGNSRIKRAYVYNGTSGREYTSITSSSPTTDDKSGDHGTHTSSTAGGSSVIVNNNTVTVTDNHANATYGGMAPGADLYLAGINGLADTYISNAFANIINYANSNKLPVVVSNSWGSQMGPHDGTGEFADVVATYFGENYPNRICLFASSNDAGNPKDGEGGGYFVTGTASSSNPLRTIIRSATFIDADGGCYYDGIIANAWCSSTNVSSMGIKIYVLNTSTGDVLTSTTVTPTTNGVTVSGLSTYFEGTLYAFKDYINSDKTQVMLYAPNGLESKSYSATTQNGESYYKSKYTLAMEIYPTSGSASIDVWGGNSCYFTNYLNTNGYNWTKGSDDMSVSDEATIPNVISIGAYVSKNKIKNYGGTTYDYTSQYTMGDIAYFSSYATPTASPTGQQYPWITAPGARLVAGGNHYHTASVDNYSYYGSNYNYDLVVNSSTSPYVAMQGTSMATPTAAGIVALWLQAAKETGQQLTNNDIKEIMRETAINDSYTTTGANASHFGNGKIDALAGISYILGANDQPTIMAEPTDVTINAEPGETKTQTIQVTGRNLTLKVNVALNDPNHVFSISQNTITAAQAEQGFPLNVSFNATEEGTYTGTITLSNAEAETVTIQLTGVAKIGGTASDNYLNIARYASIDDEGWNTNYVDNLYKYNEYPNDEVAWLTLPIYGAWSATYYNGTQKWITTNVNTTSNKYYGTGWSSSAEMLGSAPYFTTASARCMGYNSRNNSTQETFNFFVTNTTAVKMLGLGQSRASSSYPATLKVYECTLNNDGTLTASTTAVKSESNSSTSGTFVLSATDLDMNKIYKVEAATYRSYICEIGFQTPIEVVRTPTITTSTQEISLTTPAGTSTSQSFTAMGEYLEGNINITLNDPSGVFAIDKQTINMADAANNTTINLTFSPESAGDYQATVTLSSNNAENVTVTINGQALQPEIIADPELLTFETEAGTPVTATFQVLGENLADVVSIQLNDQNGVFQIDKESITVSQAQEGTDVTVTFTPTAIGSYDATIDINTLNAESATVTLQGTATKPIPEYFDVTITSVGLTTLYLDFPVQIPYDTYDPDLLGVYYVYKIEGKNLKKARINNIIPANTGVIVHGNEGTYRFPTMKGSTYQLPYTNYLSGSVVRILTSEVLAQSQYPDGKIYTLGRGGSENFINFYNYTGKYLNANKAFLLLPGDTSINYFTFDDDTNGITTVNMDDDKSGWYTPQGVKLNGKPTQKGIYIHQGKATTIK